MQRKLSVFLFILLTPVAVGLMLNIMVGIGNIVHDEGHRAENAIEEIRPVPPCGEGPDYNPQTDEACTSVGYAMIGPHSDVNAPEYSRYHEVMSIFAKQNNFTVGRDVKPLPSGSQQAIFDHVDTY